MKFKTLPLLLSMFYASSSMASGDSKREIVERFSGEATVSLSEAPGLPHVDEPDWGEGLGTAVMATEWEPWPEHLDNHSATWFFASELLEFDYYIEFENRRDETASLKDTLPEGLGVVTTVREYIGQYYFDELEKLRSIGDPKDTRVVISFCS